MILLNLLGDFPQNMMLQVLTFWFLLEFPDECQQLGHSLILMAKPCQALPEGLCDAVFGMFESFMHGSQTGPWRGTPPISPQSPHVLILFLRVPSLAQPNASQRFTLPRSGMMVRKGASNVISSTTL